MKKLKESLKRGKGKSMADKKILRRVILHRPIDEVVFELMQQGWPLIADNGDKAFLYKDKAVRNRALKAVNN
jgi:hypothetical protein